MEERSASNGLAGGQAEMPLASAPDIFQGGLFVLAVLAALYAAREIVLPIVLAVMLKLLLQPALRTLRRFHVPGALGALLLIGVLFGTLIAFGTALSGPAVSWAQKLPEGVPRLQEHLSFLRAPIEAAHQFLQRAEDWFSGGQPSGGSSKGGPLSRACWIAFLQVRGIWLGSRSRPFWCFSSC
jgi:predicted PurR-regulated permease PerM